MKFIHPIDMSQGTAEERARFIGRILGLLRKSAFRRQADWAKALIEPGGNRVTSRADHAMWLRANDLQELSFDCVKIHVPPGHVLVWLSADNEKGACAGFALVDLLHEVEAVRAALEQETNTTLRVDVRAGTPHAPASG